MLSLEYLAELAQQHRDLLNIPVREFSIRGKELAFNSAPAIMGVINLSPDSWYRESVCLNSEMAIRRAHVLAAQGADIIDIGAESTLAHAARADEALQNSKLLPVLRGLKDFQAPVSVETYDLAVAKQCLETGASILNLTGTEKSGEMYVLAKSYDAAVIICYVQGQNVRAVGDFDFKQDAIGAMEDYFEKELLLAQKAGLTKIFLDPGLGFYYRNLQDSAFRISYQMETFLNSFRLRKLGFPICHALPHAFESFGEEVRCAEPFFAVLAALGKTSLFRTHEVAKTKAVLDSLVSFHSRESFPASNK
jgi:dihydropteroate synthase